MFESILQFSSAETHTHTHRHANFYLPNVVLHFRFVFWTKEGEGSTVK